MQVSPPWSAAIRSEPPGLRFTLNPGELLRRLRRLLLTNPRGLQSYTIEPTTNLGLMRWRRYEQLINKIFCADVLRGLRQILQHAFKLEEFDVNQRVQLYAILGLASRAMGKFEEANSGDANPQMSVLERASGIQFVLYLVMDYFDLLRPAT
jgi:hypothetical protein